MRARGARVGDSPTVTPISGHHHQLLERRKLSISWDYNDIKLRLSLVGLVVRVRVVLAGPGWSWHCQTMITSN